MTRPTNTDAMRIANARTAVRFLTITGAPRTPCRCSVRRRHRVWVITCTVHGVLQLTATWPYAMRRANKHARGDL